MQKKVLSFVLSFVLLLGLISPSITLADTRHGDLISGEDFLTSMDIDALTLIENMPDELLTDDSKETYIKRLDWMIENATDQSLIQFFTHQKYTLTDSNVGISVTPRYDVWKCVTGVAKSLVTTAVPVSKILKIKKAIKLAGGTKKFVDKFSKAYKKYSNQKVKGKKKYTKTEAAKKAMKDATKTSPELLDAALAIVGIDSFIDGCIQ